MAEQELLKMNIIIKLHFTKFRIAKTFFRQFMFGNFLEGPGGRKILIPYS